MSKLVHDIQINLRVSVDIGNSTQLPHKHAVEDVILGEVLELFSKNDATIEDKHILSEWEVTE